MKQHDFELAVMKLWTTSLVPMTRVNILAFTKVERSKLDGWLDELIKDSILELDSDEEGELVWNVRGAKRPARGLTSVAQLEKLRAIEGEAPIVVKAGPRATAQGSAIVAASPKKSLVASGILSFLFGPLGWLYAAPLVESIPAAFAYILLCSIIPKFILVYILAVVGPLSGIAGVLYAWSYNRIGRRATLFLKSGHEKLLDRPR